MQIVLAAATQYGGYVSLIKLVVFTGMFFAWIPLVNWIHSDTQSVRTNVRFWTGTVAACGAAALIISPSKTSTVISSKLTVSIRHAMMRPGVKV